MPQTHINEVPEMAAYLLAAMSADSALNTATVGGFWQTAAPKGTPTPFVTLTFAPTPDVVVTGALRVYARGMWDIVAWGPVATPGMRAKLATIATRIDAVLHGSAGATALALIMGVDRLEPLAQDDAPTADGTIWSRLGGRYEVYAQPLTGA